MPFTSPHSRDNGYQLRTIYPLLVIPLLAIVLIAGTLALYLNTQVRAAKPDILVPLADSVPAQVAKSKLIGPTNAQQTISLTLELRLRNATELDNYIADMNRPQSINYHRHLSLNQLIGAFSPTPASHDALVRYLQGAGFTITYTFKHRMGIVFQGTIGQVEQVFHVHMNNYIAPDGESFYSNDTNPLLPSSLLGYVQSITGLNNATRYNHAPVHLQSGANVRLQRTAFGSKSVPNAGLSCPTSSSSAFLPNQIQAAYDLNGLYNAGYHGEGQTIALFELDQFNINDINAYRSCFAQNSPTVIQTINVDGGAPSPANGDGGPVEVELDAELVASAAPRLSTLKIYSAPNTQNAALDEWMQIVQDAPAVVSTSWGTCEINTSLSVAQSENNLFAMAVAQGQSIFAASGDAGSSGCLGDSTNTTALSAGDPAAQPNVTGVGGTVLFINSNNSYNHETVWNASSPDGASGGGLSIYWSQPSWQNAPGVNNQYSNGKREVPDVALNAELYSPGKGYLIYCTEAVSGCTSSNGNYWFTIGGTSCAAPLWAAVMAMTNEESVKQGGFNIGFVNPLLYQIANNSSQYSNDFHDVTSGNNDYQGMQGGRYPTTSAYDMATGLGSFDAAHLANDLVAMAKANNGTRLAPANTTWYFAEGSVGGGFQEFLTLQNPSPSQTSNVTITYLLQNATPPTVTVQKTVNASTRLTVDVDKDLGTTSSGNHISVAAIVHVTSGAAIVAERPMYFTFLGTIKSGTDVLGATSPGTSYYFPEGNSTQNSTSKYWTFVSILNPSTSATANVTMTYYTGSCGASGQAACPTEKLQVGPLQRGTASPGDSSVGLHQKVAISVSSNLPIVVERPMYVSDTIANAGGLTTGAASQVGATAPGTDWLFAEGYTGTHSQEDLELANFGTSNANATIKLEYTDGSTHSFSVPVAAEGLAEFDVNAHAGATTSVSAEVTSDQPIVADRLMFFHFTISPYSYPGITDVVGATSAHNVYAFAEGYTGKGVFEFLTLQNPTNSNETVAVTIFDQYGIVYQQQVVVLAHSRKTIGVNSLTNFANVSVSMTVQALGSNALIVAERPMYFGYFGDNGGTDVIGYIGG